MKRMVVGALVCGLVLVHGAKASQIKQDFGAVGAVFAATNDVNQNEVVMYARAETGALKYVGKFATGGRGEGGVNDPLQSEGSLVLSNDHKYLLAVNAGSSTLSVFQVNGSGLRLLGVEPSHGGNPVSVAIHEDLVYVANFGGTYHTAGFHLRPGGEIGLHPQFAADAQRSRY